jgi:hypothetical protein
MEIVNLHIIAIYRLHSEIAQTLGDIFTGLAAGIAIDNNRPGWRRQSFWKDTGFEDTLATSNF